MMGGMGMGLTKAVTDTENEGKKQIEDQIAELDSPGHLSELRKIRAQTALTQLMSNPESPLSEYDPEEVMQAYNEVVQLSPRLADQPSALAPLLNRKLMGNAEPFEVGETLKMEESLAKTQATPGLTKEISNDEPKPEEKKEQTSGSLKPLLDSVEGSVSKAFSGSGGKKSPTDVMNNEASILS